jgi:uncharacterized protein YggE
MTTTRMLLLVCTVLAGTVAGAGAQVPASPVVVTQGEAAVKRAPDRAWLTIATETRDTKAAEARRISAEDMTALQGALRALKLEADAIRTTGYSLVPDMEWKSGRGIVRGYIVRNQIEVRIDDLDRLSEVIDTANSSRGTSLSIVGPRFGLKDEASVQAEALRLAVASAMSRAQAMAVGAGRTLGAIQRIEEHNLGGRPAPPQPMVMRMAAAESTATPIEPGEIEIHALVTLTVELR